MKIIPGLLLTLASWTALAGADVQWRKPNIVFILVDDMPYAGTSITGNPVLETPHMDRIAKEGMLFSRAYSETVCGPSRATIMTGQFAGRHGRTDNVPGVHPFALMQEPLRPLPVGVKPGGFPGDGAAGARLPDPVPPGGYSLVQALKAGGYRTAISGKWHLPMQHLTPATAPRYGFDFCNERADRSQPYRDARRFTDDAIRFMRENREHAFFLYVPFVAVHGPHFVPPEDQARWKEKLRGRDVGIHPDMLASLEFVDRSVGRVLDALDELGLADNTIVLLASDNGGVSRTVHSVDNHPLRMGKGTLYEGGVRVPLFIRWPGQITPGRRSDVPVHFADLFPTLCDAAGVRIDPNHKLDGTSLLPLFRDSVLPERTLFITFPHYLAGYATTPARAVVRGRYKLVWHPYDHLEFEGGRITSESSRYVPEPLVELFDLETDPGERTNLAPRYPSKVAELKELFTAWAKVVGAKDVAPNPAYDARRPMFNTRDEALRKESKGTK
jgi:arylsulfatase A-like enzyme